MTSSASETRAPTQRVLLDESVPRDLLLHLAGIDVVTVQQLGALLAALPLAGIGQVTHVEQRESPADDSDS